MFQVPAGGYPKGLAPYRTRQALTAQDFHKSMTTYGNHTLWQDVYQPHTAAGEVYLKLTVIEDVLIVSFKEL